MPLQSELSPDSPAFCEPYVICPKYLPHCCLRKANFWEAKFYMCYVISKWQNINTEKFASTSQDVLVDNSVPKAGSISAREMWQISITLCHRRHVTNIDNKILREPYHHHHYSQHVLCEAIGKLCASLRELQFTFLMNVQSQAKGRVRNTEQTRNPGRWRCSAFHCF